ncbi:hypothetical protein SESBI_15354 [Sesbania bispinosa]|nr:hypothetical protein SESBI_15354 [Sesbania bispinosa]
MRECTACAALGLVLSYPLSPQPEELVSNQRNPTTPPKVMGILKILEPASDAVLQLLFSFGGGGL